MRDFQYPNKDVIPCFAVVHDTFSDYADEVASTIDSAKAYLKRKEIT